MPQFGLIGDITLDELMVAIKASFPNRTVRIGEEGVSLSQRSDSDRVEKDDFDGKRERSERGSSDIVVLKSLPNSSSSAAAALIENHKVELERKDRLVKEMEHASMKSLATIQALHKQQHTLFDEFVLLRQKYDEQKALLISTLWITCGSVHPELKNIPPAEDANDFVESDDKVGGYLVGNVLGEGQFATVRSCWKSENDDEEFAMKVIKKERVTTYNSLKRVSNEIEILSKLNSKYIVYIEEVFHTHSKLYMITEKGGRDLFEFFDEHPDGVSELWAQDIMINILEGVFYCHAHFVCHRDLKPENILLDFDVESGRCVNLKLCDFGLSTHFSPKELLTDFCGSPGFFAPEMIIHGSYFGDKADIWSIGCILLELLLGHERFCDAWMVAYDYKILQDKKTFASEIHNVVSKLPQVLLFGPRLNDFIIQCLHSRSSDRASTKSLCQHAWLEGKMDATLQQSSASISSIAITRGAEDKSCDDDSVSYVARSPSQFSALPQQLAAGSPGSSSNSQLSPRTLASQQSSYQEALKDLYVDVRERKHLTEDHEGIHLPPIEPATPSLSKARKIVISGDELANKASSSSSSSMRATAGSRSPKNRVVDGNSTSLLPELREDIDDSETDGGDSSVSSPTKGGGGGGGTGGGSGKVPPNISIANAKMIEAADNDVFYLQDRKSPRN